MYSFKLDVAQSLQTCTINPGAGLKTAPGSPPVCLPVLPDSYMKKTFAAYLQPYVRLVFVRLLIRVFRFLGVKTFSAHIDEFPCSLFHLLVYNKTTDIPENT